MTIGAVILMALDRGQISQGPFSLYAHNYYASLLDTAHGPSRDWHGIQVFYSGVVSDDLSVLVGKDRSRPANFHFVVPAAATHGRVLDTARWVNQSPCTADGTFTGDSRTLAICVVADPPIGPTQAQKRATAELVRTLSRRFGIVHDRIAYPQGW